MKIRLTKEQTAEIISNFREVIFPGGDCFTFGDEPTIIISEDQIVKENTNEEKWDEIIKTAGPRGRFWPENLANKLDELGYDATKAYEKICGGE